MERNHQKSRASVETDTQRIETFSDSVFAIAITLLIVEIRVPQVQGTVGATNTHSLASALFALWPSYFAYILSFVMIEIFWANHHYVFQLHERSNRIFKLFNLLFLICVVFLPFPTAVLARYITDAQQQTAVDCERSRLRFEAGAQLVTALPRAHSLDNWKLLFVGYDQAVKEKVLADFDIYADFGQPEQEERPAELSLDHFEEDYPYQPPSNERYHFSVSDGSRPLLVP